MTYQYSPLAADRDRQVPKRAPWSLRPLYYAAPVEPSIFRWRTRTREGDMMCAAWNYGPELPPWLPATGDKDWQVESFYSAPADGQAALLVRANYEIYCLRSVITDLGITPPLPLPDDYPLDKIHAQLSAAQPGKRL